MFIKYLVLLGHFLRLSFFSDLNSCSMFLAMETNLVLDLLCLGYSWQ